MEAVFDPADVDIELIYELDYNQPEFDIDELDDPWFAPSEEHLIAHMVPAGSRRSMFPLALVVGCAFLIAACVGASAL